MNTHFNDLMSPYPHVLWLQVFSVCNLMSSYSHVLWLLSKKGDKIRGLNMEVVLHIILRATVIFSNHPLTVFYGVK